jgi:hypothetical protein
MPWPKTYVGADAPKEMLELVDRLMPLLLGGDHPASAALREQYARAKITTIELTGVGFFVEFEVPPDAPRAAPRNLTGGNVNIHVEGVVHDAGCVLFVRDGVIDMLEGYTYADEWPERPVVISLTDPFPLVPRGPAAS